MHIVCKSSIYLFLCFFPLFSWGQSNYLYSYHEEEIIFIDGGWFEVPIEFNESILLSDPVKVLIPSRGEVAFDNYKISGNNYYYWSRSKDIHLLLTDTHLHSEIKISGNGINIASRVENNRLFLTDMDNHRFLGPKIKDDVSTRKSSMPNKAYRERTDKASYQTFSESTADSKANIDLLYLCPEDCFENNYSDYFVYQAIERLNDNYKASGVHVNVNLVGVESVKFLSGKDSIEDVYESLDEPKIYNKYIELKRRYGADVVIFYRPLPESDVIEKENSICGLANLSFANGDFSSDWSDYAFGIVNHSSVSVGDYRYLCPPYVLDHEIGHLLGAHHDLANASGVQGAFNFSYGYGVEGVFGTIMSYISPSISKYSNTETDCSAEKCGIEGLSNNTKSMNITGGVVEGFEKSRILVNGKKKKSTSVDKPSVFLLEPYQIEVNEAYLKGNGEYRVIVSSVYQDSEFLNKVCINECGVSINDLKDYYRDYKDKYLSISVTPIGSSSPYYIEIRDDYPNFLEDIDKSQAVNVQVLEGYYNYRSLSVISASISYDGDADYIPLYIAQEGKLIIQAPSSGGVGKFTLVSLVDNSVVAADINSSNLTYSVKGDHFYAIKHIDSSVWDFRVGLVVSEGAQSFNDANLMASVSDSFWYKGELSYPGDIDYLKLTVKKFGKHVLQSSWRDLRHLEGQIDISTMVVQGGDGVQYEASYDVACRCYYFDLDVGEYYLTIGERPLGDVSRNIGIGRTSYAFYWKRVANFGENHSSNKSVTFSLGDSFSGISDSHRWWDPLRSLIYSCHNNPSDECNLSKFSEFDGLAYYDFLVSDNSLVYFSPEGGLGAASTKFAVFDAFGNFIQGVTLPKNEDGSMVSGFNNIYDLKPGSYKVIAASDNNNFHIDTGVLKDELLFRASTTDLLWLVINTSDKNEYLNFSFQNSLGGITKRYLSKMVPKNYFLAVETTQFYENAKYYGNSSSLKIIEIRKGEISEINDSDNDYIDDQAETLLGLNPLDGQDTSLDVDGDGLSAFEEYLYGTQIFTSDTDGDGIDDGKELELELDPLVEDLPTISLVRWKDSVAFENNILEFATNIESNCYLVDKDLVNLEDMSVLASSNGFNHSLQFNGATVHRSFVSCVYKEATTLSSNPQAFYYIPENAKSLNAGFFNPSSNIIQSSVIRISNASSKSGAVILKAVDDLGGSSIVSFDLGAYESKTFRSSDLEFGSSDKGLLGEIGDGTGKWSISIFSGDFDVGGDLKVTNLQRSPYGDLVNISASLESNEGDGLSYHLPFIPAATVDETTALVRIVNTNNSYADITLKGYHLNGDPADSDIMLRLSPNESKTITAKDLEQGNISKGISDQLVFGEGRQYWSIELFSEVPVKASIIYRDESTGVLTSLNGSVDVSSDPIYFFNPASNQSQQSELRLVNFSFSESTVVVNGIDDNGHSGDSPIDITLSAYQSLIITSQELEVGSDRFVGKLGDGSGKWRLLIDAQENVSVSSVVSNITGVFENMSNTLMSSSDTRFDVPTFNPASNLSQRSVLRVYNDNSVDIVVDILARDDSGNERSVIVPIVANSTISLTSIDLENGNSDKGIINGVGDGIGKWNLVVTSSYPVKGFSFVRTPSGNIFNMSSVVN